jgi:hypothetical protein
VRKSLALRTEPTVWQTEAILSRIERELTGRGADAHRDGRSTLEFRMPLPWRASGQGALLPISSGRVSVSAGAGGPRRVRYKVNFMLLRGLVLLLSAALVAIGFGWPRLTLLNALLALWAVCYGVPLAIAMSRFHRIVTSAARDVVERRGESRAASVAASVAPRGAPMRAGEPESRAERGDGPPSVA